MSSTDTATSSSSCQKLEINNFDKSVNRKDCPVSKIAKNFGKGFTKFYLIRFLISLLKKLLKVKFNITKIKVLEIIKLFFSLENLQTGLFLSLMPSLFRFLNLILNSSKLLKNLDPRVFTFVSGFISSLIGIIISEKSSIMNFVILSVMVRSMHSMLVVWLNKNGYSTQNKFYGWLVLTIASFGVLFLTFFYPSYKPITNLVNRYGLMQGTEEVEINSFREWLRLDK
jgi:hypothetical protein